MEFKAALPIYLQVKMMIKRDIVTGDLQPGSRMPSVRDMALQFTINPNTVSRVYKELEQEGICFTRRGMGTFVTEEKEKVEQLREEMAQELISQFLNGMNQLGISKKEAILMVKENSEC